MSRGGLLLRQVDAEEELEVRPCWWDGSARRSTCATAATPAQILTPLPAW